MGTQQLDFAEFYRRSADDCLRAVLVSVGDQDKAKDLVDEAFTRAFASWRAVSRHPAPAAWVVRTALNANVSRWRRRHREVPVPDPGMAAAPAMAECTDSPVDPGIMAVLMRLPARQRHQPTAPLAAWTVARQSDGTIQVTIRELSNPAGLQRKLRADGVPASVTLTGQQNPACRPYPASWALLDSVVTRTFEILPTVHHGPPAGRPGSALSLVIVMDIHPSARPGGTGVQLASTFTLLPPVTTNGGTQRVARAHVAIGLVYASPQCTG